MAHLLPKSKVEFASKSYWDSFFTKRTEAFEWYGEFHQISPIIFKYAKQNNKLLVLGCGNSTMSNDLYKSGYTSVISIDISAVVIKQMKTKYPKLDFRQMNATKLEFNDSELNIVLDKGTLDALLPDDTAATLEVVHKVLDEVSRCLHFGGRYICISLLQEHVAKVLFEYFEAKGAQDTTWVVRLHRCTEAEAREGFSMPVYIVVCSKMKRLPIGGSVFEIMAGDKALRHVSVESICEDIKEQQNFAFLKAHLRRSTLDQEYRTELFSPENQSHPKYELYVVDTPEMKSQLKFACFIVPEGRESEWLYGTPEGRKITAKQCMAFRVIFVHLNRNFHYENTQGIQEEVGGALKELAPRNFKLGTQIPMMTLGDAAGTREVIEQGHSDLSGDFVVEDVIIGLGKFRRLIFYDRQSVIQTEMRVLADGKLDFSYLASEYYKYMMVALGYFEKPGKALLLGLGGGSLASFVTKYTEWQVQAVEIDAIVIKVAKIHFALPESIQTHVQDALQFIADSNDTFQIIWLDIDSKEVGAPLTCPPKKFIEEEFLDNVVKRLTEDGVFVVNLACRDDTTCAEVYIKLKEKFKYLSMIEICQDINKVIIASGFEHTSCKFEAVQTLLRGSNADNEVRNLSQMVQNIKLTE